MDDQAKGEQQAVSDCWTRRIQRITKQRHASPRENVSKVRVAQVGTTRPAAALLHSMHTWLVH